MSVEIAAERLGVSALTVKRWAKSGKIGGFRPHFRELLIPLAALERFERERLSDTG